MPFAAVAAANCVNIPFMRQNELVDGVDVYDENGNLVGQSRVNHFLIILLSASTT